MTGPEDLFRAALAARAKAYAPFSNFAVGVALRTQSGRIFSGANIENQSFPEGWCAETTAIGHMIMAAERPEDRVIVEVVVAGELSTPLTPCGGCRQRLAEFGRPDTVVHSANAEGIRASWTLAELLPAGFALDP
ncbi:cytidine deaminase [Albimonas sp. CAU 1670]|uniref:cytidine deaminase n=1 Tax=Albimonas sp. CAU 1670 TaxID=3032599 RepID=UPI0023DC7AD1|nr:cytidine deaminase [Albimonas sp. CAU 1670]MDF2231939.1 cytidine deaminase [Albimonas sp. CAU 1670]